MGYWFDEKDSFKDCVRHIEDDKCPQSIREDAERELRERGYPEKVITAARFGRLEDL